jgi:hypothetical protein
LAHTTTTSQSQPLVMNTCGAPAQQPARKQGKQARTPMGRETNDENKPIPQRKPL